MVKQITFSCLLFSLERGIFINTLLGDYLNRLRVKEGESLPDMAKKLKVESSYLSAIENGKKYFPVEWYPELQLIYGFKGRCAYSLK